MRGKWIFELLYIKIYGLQKFLIKKGVHIGENCHIYSNISTTESYLISIGNNVTISNNVHFITHDNSICKVLPNMTDIFGCINIGNNCFIGQGATVMYGCNLADNTIVSAGAVVTKSISTPGMIIGGNPAKIIGNINDFKKSAINYAININGLSQSEKIKKITSSNLYQRKKFEDLYKG